MTYNFNDANRKRHARYRQFPNRNKLLLRQALQDMGIANVQYEPEFTWIDPDTQRKIPVWYDASFEAQGKTCLIFLVDQHTRCSTAAKSCPFNYKARQRKIANAKGQGSPFLEVWPASKDAMRAQIELWLMFLNRDPYREATKRPAFLTSQQLDRAPRTQRLR